MTSRRRQHRPPRPTAGRGFAFGLWALLLATTSASAHDVGFRVQPYLHITPRAGLMLSFLPGDEDGARPTWQQSRRVTFVDDGGREVVRYSRKVDGVHHVSVPDACGQRWRYRVEERPWSKPFSTLPCVPHSSSTTQSIAFMTDTQMNVDLVAKFAQFLDDSDAPFVLHGGDMVQRGGRASQWEDLFRVLTPALSSRVLIPTTGNHGFFSDKAGVQLERYLGMGRGHGHYSVRLGDVLVVVLDSATIEDEVSLRRQRRFAEEALAQTARWKWVLFHHAIYSRGLAMHPMAITREHQVFRDHFVPLFERHHVDLVLAGHVHLLERSVHRGITYFTGGATGGVMGVQVVENPELHKSEQVRSLTFFDVGHDEIRARSIDENGVDIDHFVLVKNADGEGSRLRKSPVAKTAQTSDPAPAPNP